MLKFKNALFVTIGVLVLSFSIGINAYASDSLYLNIPGEKQEETNWCWAASSQSIIHYLTTLDPTQTDIVVKVKGSNVNEGANYDEEIESLTDFNVSTSGKSKSVSWSEIKDNIKGWYSPMKAAISWTSGGGHAFVIYGYYDDTYTQNVSYMDPLPDNPTWNSMSYSKFVSNSNWTWYRTFDYNKGV